MQNENELVEYDGHMVEKHSFRTVVYSKVGVRKIVNSWDEYLSHKQSGQWLDRPMTDDVCDQDISRKKRKG